MNFQENIKTVSIPINSGLEHADLNIRKIPNGTIWVETQNFKATLNYLRIFTLLTQGYNTLQIANKFSLSYQTIKNTLANAIIKNTREIDGKIIIPSKINLIGKAEQLGLLSPMALLGIESIANADRNERSNPADEL